MMKITLFIVGFFTLSYLPASSQNRVDSIATTYTFIALDSNKIINDSLALLPFFQKLKLLQEGKIDKVTIVHIGDSHIQADNFSGTVRENLQQHFGNAGRGFVFPYKAARTNEPYSYKTTTNTHWDVKRNVFPEKPLPVGIAGITIESSDSNARITYTTWDKNKLDYSFNKLTLFHEKGNGYFDITVCDDFNCELGTIKSDSSLSSSFTSEIAFAKPVKNIIISPKKNTETVKCIRVYGMSLENGKKGILYHSIGVNGAEYRHYSQSEYFFEQLKELKPDLVIVSMGTNEGFAASFNDSIFYTQIDTFIQHINNKIPTTTLLLTTPGDSFKKIKRARIKNPDMVEAKNTIKMYATKHNIAYWDLHAVMGGYGSMAQWSLSGLSAKDKLHFSRKGYIMQGELFYNALMNSYTKNLRK
ncbi:MAG: hypothetical protein J0M08_11720 [Bacteroidetes bacterium]|nr:hypothetical protein [Bacteroidota bacterium]